MDEQNRSFIHKPLVYTLIAISIFSCIAISSATPLTVGNVNYAPKQAMWYIIGFIGMFATYKFGVDRIYTSAKVIYWALMVLLVPLAIIQHFPALANPLIRPVNGATSWYQIPGLGSFQPSEFMKMMILILLSKTVQEHNEHYSLHTFESDCQLLLKVASIVLPPCILIYLQNDSGVTMIIIVSVLFLLFSSGLQMRWFLFGAGLIIALVLFVAYIFLYNQDLFKTIFSGHKASRFYGWLDPEGTYSYEGYQLFNALLSLGTASLFGHGYRSVVMNFPEAQTDFIFAVITQSFGFVGGIIALILILSLDLIILKIGLNSNEKGRCFATGLFGVLFIQQIWNMSMVTGLLPITGITLPLFSYGGSSLLSYMLMMGVVLDMEKQNRILKSKLHSYE